MTDHRPCVGRLEDRVAVVTGAGRGIGRATAVRLASEGAKVVVNDLDPEPAHETADIIRAAGGEASVSLANTVDLGAAKEMVEATVATYGKLDILINNAGITRDKTFHNMTDDLFDAVIDANLRTMFHAVLAAMPYMREVAKDELKATGAVKYHRKIVNTSSVAALMGNPGQFNYVAAKGAIITTTKTLARELGPFRINVNAVAPGFVETRLTAAKQAGDELGIPEQMRQMAIAMISVGRAGVPDDIAATHAFLASPDSDFISGVTIPVTGGQIGGMG